MTSSSGPFEFYAEFRTRPGYVNAWWTDDVINDVILPPVRHAGDLSNATQFSFDGDPVPLTSPQQLAEATKTWRNKIVAIYTGAFENPEWRLHLDLDRTGPRITVRPMGDKDGSFRDRFASWIVEWSNGLSDLNCDLSIGHAAPFERPYPRPRPPRMGMGWSLGNLELYLGKRWHESEEKRKAVLTRIMEAPLVPGVRRSLDGDLLRVSFDCELEDDESVERAQILGERWLTPLVPTQVERGWNELGDQAVVPGTCVDREPFTFYDEDKKIGYWALVRDPEDGSVDEPRWQQLSAIARTGALDDGTPVTAVRLVAPVREEAVALIPRATKDGFEMVTYPGGKGLFWHVFSDEP
jgi:hypothetical protein